MERRCSFESTSQGVRNLIEGKNIKNFLMKNKAKIFLTVITLVIVSSYGINEFPILKDHGLYSYTGQKILDGVSPYSSAVKMKGPMNFYIQALLMKLFFFLPQYLAIRVGMLILVTVFVLIYHKILLSITEDRLLSVASSLVLISFTFFMELSLLGDPKLTSMIFILLSIMAIFKGRYIASGLLISLSFLCYQPTGVIIFVPLVLACLEERQPSLKFFKKIGLTALGFVIPVGGILWYFNSINSLKDFITISFIIPIEIRGASTFMSAMTVFNTFAYYCTELFFLLMSFIGGTYLVYRLIKRISKEGLKILYRDKKALTFALTFILIGMYIIRDYQTGDDLVFLLPAISFLTAFSLKEIFNFLAKKLSISSKVVGIMFLGLIALYGFLPALQPVYPQNPVVEYGKELKTQRINPSEFPSKIFKRYGYLESIFTFLFWRKGEEVDLQHQMKIANYIKGKTDENEELVSFGAPEILFLSDRNNLNRYPHLAVRGLDRKSLLKHIHTHHILKTGSLKEVKENIVSTEPEFIVTRTSMGPATIENLGLKKFIDEKYKVRNITETEEYLIYEKM